MNLPKSFKWFLKAARRGSADAQLNVGIMCYRGKGMPEDHHRALKWLRKAAKNGETKAIEFLRLLGEH